MIETIDIPSWEALLTWVNGRKNLDNAVIYYHRVQVFGWPPGHSEFFTREPGRCFAFVPAAIRDIPYMRGVPFGQLGTEYFSSKEELLNMLRDFSLRNEDEFLSVREMTEIDVVVTWKRGYRFAMGRGKAVFEDGTWKSPVIPDEDTALEGAGHFTKFIELKHDV